MNLMKKKALFLSNELYFDISKQEGGVRFCTEEYFTLIHELYDVELFKVNYRNTLLFRLIVKLGLNIYCEYDTKKYAKSLINIIEQKEVVVVFLNLSNTTPFASIIKAKFGKSVKVILCSHGNESTDYLHEVTRVKKNYLNRISFFSSFALGSMLIEEVNQRQNYLDGVLTVSPIEESLEKWLGAKKVIMIPRIVKNKYLIRKPISGRIGFIGDLSHYPNFYGINEVCKSFELLSVKENMELRLVGSPKFIGEKLSSLYPFVTYIGYLENDDLENEVRTWSSFLNPVFYYSKGVSTKLAKALGWRLPVITTSIGCRGYVWSKGSLLIADSPLDMAKKINEFIEGHEKIELITKEIEDLTNTLPTLVDNAKNLKDFLADLS